MKAPLSESVGRASDGGLVRITCVSGQRENNYKYADFIVDAIRTALSFKGPYLFSSVIECVTKVLTLSKTHHNQNFITHFVTPEL